MKVKLKDISIIIDEVMRFARGPKVADDFNLEFCTYWTNSFLEGQNLAAPDPVVKDIRKDIERVAQLTDKKTFSYQDFESLGTVIKAIGLQIEKNKRFK